MPVLKTHYDGFYDAEEPPQAYCGSIADELLASDRWNEVTCKKCLRLKDKAVKERKLIEEDIVKQMGEMCDFYKEQQKADDWWNSLTLSQKISYEYKTFGDGEIMEDNTLSNKDILLMYRYFIDGMFKQ
jgi:hypothetical protein